MSFIIPVRPDNTSTNSAEWRDVSARDAKREQNVRIACAIATPILALVTVASAITFGYFLATYGRIAVQALNMVWIPSIGTVALAYEACFYSKDKDPVTDPRQANFATVRKPDRSFTLWVQAGIKRAS